MFGSDLPDLPLDVWLLIIDRIDKATLRHLLHLNRFFHQQGTEALYRDFAVTCLEKYAIVDLVKLKNPDVAKRVRALTLHPYFMHRDFVAPQDRQEVMDARVPPESRRLGFFERCMQGTLSVYQVRVGHSTRKVTEKRRDLVVRNPYQLLSDAICSMGHVQNLTIDCSDIERFTWYGMPGYPPLSINLYVPATFRALGATLQCLVLRGPPKKVDLLADFARDVQFPLLNELEMEFTHSTTLLLPRVQLIVRSLVKFIGGLKEQLHQLTISSCPTLDSAELFLNIDPLPHLTSFRYKDMLTSPSYPTALALPHFLQRCTSIRDVSLDVETTDEAFWEHLTFKDQAAPSNIQSLTINYHSNPHPPIAFISSIIEQSARSFTALSIRGTHLYFDETSALTHSFPNAGKLYSLRLSVAVVSPQLIDLLSTTAPALQSLTLSRRPTPILSATDSHNGPLPSENVTDDNMVGKVYPDWKLCDLKIWHFSFEGDVVIDVAMMDILKKSIPSIGRYSGGGRSEEYQRQP